MTSQLQHKSAFEIACDFNTTFIIPIVKLSEYYLAYFRYHRPFLQRNGLEVILCTNDNNTTFIEKLVHEYPLINWKIIFVNEQNASFCSLIEVGIKNAVKEYIFVSRHDVWHKGDGLLTLRFYGERNSNNYFEIISSIKGRHSTSTDVVCSLLFARATSTRISTARLLESSDYLRSYSTMLTRAGIRKADTEEIIIAIKENSFNIEAIAYKPNPNYAVYYDWQQCSLSHSRCIKYLERFKKFELLTDYCFRRSFRIIALIQTYNEKEQINDALSHIDTYCDGIILLDDESNDGTYDIATSPKLLLKVQKKRSRFNDLENRNILLDLSSFFRAEWFYFIDADERFNVRFNNIFDLVNSEGNCLSFSLIHLWDDESTYRVDIKDADTAKDGILTRCRMFRSNGHLQILLTNQRILHFSPIPYPKCDRKVDILLMHYGTLSRKNRVTKYNFYMKEDLMREALDYSYSYLLDEHPILRDVAMIRSLP